MLMTGSRRRRKRPAARASIIIDQISSHVANANMQHYVASRTLTGLLLGSTNSAELQRSLPAAGLITAAVTVFAQLTLMFLAPPHSITAFLADTIRSAVYNGVLAIPVYALLKKFVAPVVR